MQTMKGVAPRALAAGALFGVVSACATAGATLNSGVGDRLLD
jgi:hypothetical protein